MFVFFRAHGGVSEPPAAEGPTRSFGSRTLHFIARKSAILRRRRR